MKLYVNLLSPNVRRVRLTAAVLGLALEETKLDFAKGEHKHPDFLALNPNGAVPTLVDGDFVLTESAAILLYLADRYPQARLAPEDRAQFYRWLVFMTNALQTAFLRMFYPERYGGGDEVRRVAAVEADGYFELIERSVDSRDWLVGEHRTAADLFLFMLTRWGRRLESPAWDRPAIRAHFLRRMNHRDVAKNLRGKPHN